MATAAKAYPPIILGFFARGLNTNRQPLFSALTGVGLQVIQFKDYLIDGVNIECSDRFTLQRAPGFVKFCSAQLAASEFVKQFYSTRDLAGNVYPLVDTNQHLYWMTPSSLTNLWNKGTAAQGFIQRVGGVTYYANGTDLVKWIPPRTSLFSTLPPWGVSAPTTKPVVVPGMGNPNGFWTPNFSFVVDTGLLDGNGNIEFSFNGTAVSNPGQIPVWNAIPGATTVDGAIFWQNNGPIGMWQASTVYNSPAVVLDTNGNLQLLAVATGTSGGTVPSWNATFAGGTADNTLTWRNVGSGSILAYSGYSYVYAFRTVSGNLSTASPATTTGPVLGPGSVSPSTVSAWSITSNVVTFTVPNSLIAGAKVVMSGFGTSTFFNGVTLTVSGTGLSSSQFEAAFTHANGSATEAGVAHPVLAVLTGAGSANSECTATASITNVSVDANSVVTLTAPNIFTAGINVQFSGLTGAAFLNGKTLQVTSATSTSFTVELPGQSAYGPASDSGLANFLAVEIYRTLDGGGVYYFDGCTANGSWTFNDIAADTDLDTELIAALNHQNDPPPAGVTLIAWWSNRLWLAVGNKLYFTGGPDILNGIPEECVPPGNVFVFPGALTSLKPTTGGLAVTISDEVWAILGGPQTVAYYPEKVLSHFGALSPNCVKQDGDTLYIYSSQKQLTVLSGSGKVELGAGGSGVCPVGDVLANGMSTLSLTASAWPADTSYLTIHRQGEDSGVYLSNGIESIMRFGLNVGNFSPIRQPKVTGSPVAGALNSVETSPGQYSLLLGPATANDYIYARSLTTFSDNGHAYPSNAAVGNIVVSEPGQPVIPIEYIAGYFFNRGSLPSISFFPNDITPAAFIPLPTSVAEPALLPSPLNLISKRWPLMMNQNATPIQIRHMQVKIDFGTIDTVKNELIELGLLPMASE